VTLEKGYADDLQETMHKVKQQLEGCLEQDLSVGEGTAILELFRALPELHDLARQVRAPAAANDADRLGGARASVSLRADEQRHTAASRRCSRSRRRHSPRSPPTSVVRRARNRPVPPGSTSWRKRHR
jgi:hypothetical protein